MKPAKTNELQSVKLEAPRLEQAKPLLLAGFNQHDSPETMFEIPRQWERFVPHIGHIPGQVGLTAFGAVLNVENRGAAFDYLSAIELPDSAILPGEFTIVQIPALNYAIFHQQQHVSKIRETMDAIWGTWFPTSGYVLDDKTTDAPHFLERYG